MKATRSQWRRTCSLSRWDSSVFLFLLSVALCWSPTVTTNDGNDPADTCNNMMENGSCSSAEGTKAPTHHDEPLLNSRVPPTCRLVMAESSIPDGGWGVFSLSGLPRGVPVSHGDVVLQVPDVNVTHAYGLRRLLHDYVWDSQETGGFYEGRSVFSVLPGMGMLANGLSSKSNILPFVPLVSEGDLIRTSSPGAGAISHYYNYTFFVQRPIPEGGEVFCNYGRDWFHERVNNLTDIIGNEDTTTSTSDNTIGSRPVEWLKEHGWCLDNLKPGPSTNKEAGRGAFATRNLARGTVIAPIPVLVIDKRSSLYTTTRIRPKTNAEREEPDNSDDVVVVDGHQLLLNYCFGHVHSSLLLYPYSPMVNLINHDGPNYNAEIRWSQQSERWTNMSLEEIRSTIKTSLLLELVATQDIEGGQEVFVHYGQAWQDAWDHHVASWQPMPDADLYTPAYVMEDVVGQRVRTQQEQKMHPYPENVFTSCFYRYSDNKSEAENLQDKRGETTTFEWKLSRGLFELRNLRPCSVLARDEVPTDQGGTTTLFTVLIRNRYGLSPQERIPKGTLHIVKKVPRQAIRFSDKIYTTDQHLENAFRHEIQLPHFPSRWMDKKETQKDQQ